ncbi:MAG: PIN domain-containing protein [Anaerolineae bacterium]|nr:PIN domain-containing protein [Anaerolineae bacterium]MCX8066303.1 PIN domain-containing protein [Anaerolineae bacterium]
MKPAAVTDTHSLIWFLEDSPRLGLGAGQFFDDCVRGESIVYVPTICLVEIVYLYEKGRIPAVFRNLLAEELRQGSSFIVADLTWSVVEALSRVPRTLAPDMPDRIIAATALSLEVPLITRDHSLAQIPGLQIIW